VPDDKELVRELGRGNETAFRELVTRESRYLYGIAHAMAGNAEDAEDLVQETFVGALKTRFRGEASVRTWLVKILIKRAAMLRRSSRRKKVCPFPSDANIEESAPISGAASGSGRSDARMDLSVMLAGLSPEHRAVIVLRELEGMSYEDMAAVLNIPRGTVESRLYRAREELRIRFWGYL